MVSVQTKPQPQVQADKPKSELPFQTEYWVLVKAVKRFLVRRVSFADVLMFRPASPIFLSQEDAFLFSTTVNTLQEERNDIILLKDCVTILHEVCNPCSAYFLANG